MTGSGSSFRSRRYAKALRLLRIKHKGDSPARPRAELRRAENATG